MYPLCKLWVVLNIPKILTAPRVGIDNKKEILPASNRLNLSILVAVIVIPDLLTPGISDKIWNKPINKADFYVKFFSISKVLLYLSLK